MRTLPAVDLDIAAQSGWRWLVDGLTLLALITLAGWWLAAAPALSGHWRGGLLLLAALASMLAWRTRQSRPCRLRWDGRQWFCAPATRAEDQPLVAGHLSVMLDLQLALLLRFDADAGSGTAGGAPRWIAVQRGGSGERWHELRCAVFNAVSPTAAGASSHRLESDQ